MPVSELHARVAAIALRVAAEHGFALGGGNALLAHGIITRPTADVDLFTDKETGVDAAASGVESALHEAGFQTARQDDTGGLADIFPGMGEGLAEWVVTGPAGEKMALQMAYFDRRHEPVIMEIGPVLDLEDVVGGKVAALASRSYERDYADTAAALEHYDVGQLIGFARRLDPGLEDRDFADAGRRLDQMPDTAFTALGLSPQDVTALRARFAAWPREAPPRQAGPDAAAWTPEPPDADQEHEAEP
ncbi:MAG: nucleotidyl transferase AbiEii/AbiGii toxin family protein [Streptosporangiaceae bacterium]